MVPRGRPGYHPATMACLDGGWPMAGFKSPIAVFFAAFLACVPAGAAEPDFGAYEMTAAAGRYVIVTDANVRAKPETKSERLTVLRKGERVEAAGRPKGTEWIAVRREGKDLGFVYKTVAAPMIDGEVAGPLTGALEAEGKPLCAYTVAFTGKFNVPDELQQTADYEAAFECEEGDRTIEFRATMFITELPYLDTTKHEFQINVDILGVLGPDEDEGIFSVISVYRLLEKEVAFDSITEEGLGSGADIEPRPADGVRAALVAALEIAHAAWGPKLWTALAKS